MRTITASLMTILDQIRLASAPPLSQLEITDVYCSPYSLLCDISPRMDKM
jgi:hypothetical protein